MPTVLIVEDKESLAQMLASTFQSEGFIAETAFTIKDGLKALSKGEADAVVTDLKLPDGTGMEIVEAVKDSFPFIPIIVMTAFGTIEIAVKAVKEGAYDFVTKPFDTDYLLLLVRRALEEKKVKKESLLQKNNPSQTPRFHDIIGASPELLKLTDRIKRVASLKTTVLILGESGTGKELVSRSIHNLSDRAQESFVPVNCAAIPRDLIESELFGHEKGAFTGATEARHGKFEIAHRGTIFLDEIGDMDMALQAKLLRVLQENELVRVGGSKTIKVDMRVIAASNKNLEKEVEEGRFREDLFYRLNVFPILVPPLRERVEDIIILAGYFSASFAKEMNKHSPVITPEIEKLLLSYDWNGNVRELKNVMERAVILCDGEVFLHDHFDFNKERRCDHLPADASLHEIAESAAKSAEKRKIEMALRETNGNKSRAAEMLKVSYKTLLTKIKEYGL